MNNLRKLTAAFLALALLCLCASCSFGQSKTAGEESSVEADTSLTQDITQENEAPAVRDANYKQIPGGEKFTGARHDKYSNRCDMIVSHIGGNYYDINITWSNGRESTICMSFTGTYNSETDALDYTGTEYELHVTENDEYSAYLINDKCEGSFSFKDEDTLVWSERKECKFILKGDAYESDEFAKITTTEEYINVTGGEEYGYSYSESPRVVSSLVNGVTVNIVERGDTQTLIACGPYEGYVPNDNLTDTGLVYAKAEITALWQSDTDDESEPAFIASESYYARNVVFTAVNPVSDFRFLSVSVNENDEGEIVFDSETLYSLERLDDSITIKMSFPGDLPTNAVSYVDSYGDTCVYAVEISGRDGDLVMSEITLAD